MFCLFLSSLRAPVTWKELCEQTTRLHNCHNNKWISELLHKHQWICISLCWDNTHRDNTYLQRHFELILDSLQKCKPQDQTTRKGICLIFKKNIAHLTRRRTLRALIIVSAERLKTLFVQAKFTRTLCIWTIHVPNENDSAIVIPTISGDCATKCNCSQNCHTCGQQKIDSFRDVWFRGNPGWQLL